MSKKFKVEDTYFDFCPTCGEELITIPIKDGQDDEFEVKVCWECEMGWASEEDLE